jgi:hypothetical protein
MVGGAERECIAAATGIGMLLSTHDGVRPGEGPKKGAILRQWAIR